MDLTNSETMAPVTPPEKRTGLIEHVALFRWKEEASQAAIDGALAELRKLKDKIPGIVDISSAANFSERAKSYAHVLVIRFRDRAALGGFGPHPEHQRVVKNFVSPIRADSLVLDYEL
jgi:hypothetical protein